MLTTGKIPVQKNSSGVQKETAEKARVKRFVGDYSPDEIKNALIAAQDLTNPLTEVVAIGDAVFEFINQSELSLEMKNAFYRLQKQFDFYKNLLPV